MPSVTVEGVLNHIRVHVGWHDGEVGGDAVFLKLIEQTVERAANPRFYDDPIAFAAIAIKALESYSDGPVRVVTEDIEGAVLRGMEGVVPTSGELVTDER
jgi:hypothetical protein